MECKKQSLVDGGMGGFVDNTQKYISDDGDSGLIQQFREVMTMSDTCSGVNDNVVCENAGTEKDMDKKEVRDRKYTLARLHNIRDNMSIDDSKKIVDDSLEEFLVNFLSASSPAPYSKKKPLVSAVGVKSKPDDAEQERLNQRSLNVFVCDSSLDVGDMTLPEVTASEMLELHGDRKTQGNNLCNGANRNLSSVLSTMDNNCLENHENPFNMYFVIPLDPYRHDVTAGPFFEISRDLKEYNLRLKIYAYTQWYYYDNHLTNCIGPCGREMLESVIVKENPTVHRQIRPHIPSYTHWYIDKMYKNMADVIHLNPFFLSFDSVDKWRSVYGCEEPWCIPEHLLDSRGFVEVKHHHIGMILSLLSKNDLIRLHSDIHHLLCERKESLKHTCEQDTYWDMGRIYTSFSGFKERKPGMDAKKDPYSTSYFLNDDVSEGENVETKNDNGNTKDSDKDDTFQKMVDGMVESMDVDSAIASYSSNPSNRFGDEKPVIGLQTDKDDIMSKIRIGGDIKKIITREDRIDWMLNTLETDYGVRIDRNNNCINMKTICGMMLDFDTGSRDGLFNMAYPLFNSNNNARSRMLSNRFIDKLFHMKRQYEYSFFEPRLSKTVYRNNNDSRKTYDDPNDGFVLVKGRKNKKGPFRK